MQKLNHSFIHSFTHQTDIYQYLLYISALHWGSSVDSSKSSPCLHKGYSLQDWQSESVKRAPDVSVDFHRVHSFFQQIFSESDCVPGHRESDCVPGHKSDMVLPLKVLTFQVVEEDCKYTVVSSTELSHEVYVGNICAYHYTAKRERENNQISNTAAHPPFLPISTGMRWERGASVPSAWSTSHYLAWCDHCLPHWCSLTIKNTHSSSL